MNRFLWQQLLLRRPEGEGEAEPPVPDFSEFAKVLDPFASPADSGAEGGEGGKSEETPARAAGGEPATPPVAPSSPPEGQAQKEEAPVDPLASIREEVQKFMAKAPQAPQPAAPAPKAEPAAPEPAKATPDDKPRYNFEVPDQLVDAIFSDDRTHAKAAISGLMTSLANRLAEDFGKALQTFAQHVEQKVPERVLSQVDQRKQWDGIKADFYGAFPALAAIAQGNPVMEQALWQQISNVGAQHNLQEWNAEFRDGVGKMLHLTLGIPLPAPGAPSTAPGTPKQPRKPTFSAGGNGAGRPAGSDKEANQFLEVLQAGSS